MEKITKQLLRKKISRGQLSEVLALIGAATDQEEVKNKTTLLGAQITAINNSKRDGTVTQEQAEVSYNRVRSAVLNLVGQLDIPEKSEPAVSLSPKWTYKKWMTAVIVLLVSLCCIIYTVWIDPCALDVSTTACRLLLSMGICGMFLGASLFFPATRKENWALAGIMSLLAVSLYTINPATFLPQTRCYNVSIIGELRYGGNPHGCCSVTLNAGNYSDDTNMKGTFRFNVPIQRLPAPLPLHLLSKTLDTVVLIHYTDPDELRSVKINIPAPPKPLVEIPVVEGLESRPFSERSDSPRIAILIFPFTHYEGAAGAFEEALAIGFQKTARQYDLPFEVRIFPNEELKKIKADHATIAKALKASMYYDGALEEAGSTKRVRLRGTLVFADELASFLFPGQSKTGIGFWEDKTSFESYFDVEEGVILNNNQQVFQYLKALFLSGDLEKTIEREIKDRAPSPSLYSDAVRKHKDLALECSRAFETAMRQSANPYFKSLCYFWLSANFQHEYALHHPVSSKRSLDDDSAYRELVEKKYMWEIVRLVPNTILAQEIQYKYAQRITASKPREAISVILKLISTDSSRIFIYQDLAEAYKVLGDSVNYRRYMTEYEKKTRLSSYNHDYRRDVTIYKNFHGQDTTIREEFIEENCIVETRKRGDKILKQTRVCCGDTVLVK